MKRRNFLVATSLVLAVGVAITACGSGGGDAAAPGTASAHSHHLHHDGEVSLGEDGRWMMRWNDLIEVSAYPPDAEPTDEERAAGEEFLAAVREASKRFVDQSVAQAEGYENIAPFDEFHFVNTAYLSDDTTLDPQRPEFVMFDPDTGEFLGVMFTMPFGQRGPQFAGPLTRWHYHDEELDDVCWVDEVPRVGLVDPDTGACRSGEKRRATTEMLHVWLVPNLTGPFATSMTPPS